MREEAFRTTKLFKKEDEDGEEEVKETNECGLRYGLKCNMGFFRDWYVNGRKKKGNPKEEKVCLVHKFSINKAQYNDKFGYFLLNLPPTIISPMAQSQRIF